MGITPMYDPIDLTIIYMYVQLHMRGASEAEQNEVFFRLAERAGLLE